jgi:hypothetical protein
MTIHRLLILSLTGWLLLSGSANYASAAGKDKQRKMYSHAYSQAIKELRKEISSLELGDGSGKTLKTVLKKDKELARQVDWALLGSWIASERKLEDGGLEIDVELPSRYLPARIQELTQDIGRYVQATGYSRGSRRAKPMSDSQYWGLRGLRVTGYTIFLFTGVSRIQAEKEAVVRSRTDAGKNIKKQGEALRMPDGRSLRDLVDDTIQWNKLGGRITKRLHRTYAQWDSLDGYVEVDYEILPGVLPSILSGLLTDVTTGLELAPGVDREEMEKAARRSAVESLKLRLKLLQQKGDGSVESIADLGDKVWTTRTKVLDPYTLAVDIVLPRKEINDSLHKRLYDKAMFPVVSRGYAGWDSRRKEIR